MTNPPYLARNKCSDKSIFDKWGQNDLYKCFIASILDDPPLGGLIIVPLNFWCSIRKGDCELRKKFLLVFDVIRLNIFEESVFDDTDYVVCSFLFVLKEKKEENSIINTFIYPGAKNLNLELYNWTIGGELYALDRNGQYQISRLLEGGEGNSNILLKAIDDNAENKICLKWSKEPYYGKPSSRTYATLVVIPKISEEKQKEIIEKFNKILNEAREKYCSLFLTNYREPGRKRISFDLVYSIVGNILNSQF